MSIVTDSTLRAMLEQLHAALSDDDGKGARVWAALTADNFAEIQVGDFFNDSRYRFAVLFKTSSKIVGVGTYIGGDLEITRYEVNLVGGVLQTPVMTKLASLADLENLKRGEFSSLTASNFADVKVGDKVINGICIYKTSVACVVYTGYQKLIQYELANGVVTPYEMTVPEKGEVAALKTAVNGKWDKPVSYGDAKPITPENFHSVKPGDYLYGTMCVRGSNGGTELQFSGSGTYRKVHLKEASLEDKLMGTDKVVEHEYGVLATTAQLNALKTEVDAKADKTALDAKADLSKRYVYSSTWTKSRVQSVKVGDVIELDNCNYIVCEVYDEGSLGVGFYAVGGRCEIQVNYGTSLSLNYYKVNKHFSTVQSGFWNDILVGDTVGNVNTPRMVVYTSASEIRAFDGLNVYVYLKGTGAITPTVKTIQFA